MGDHATTKKPVYGVGIPPQNQRLLCGGVQLNKGSATLASAGIHAESTIQLLLRLRGGGSSKVIAVGPFTPVAAVRLSTTMTRLFTTAA